MDIDLPVNPELNENDIIYIINTVNSMKITEEVKATIIDAIPFIRFTENYVCPFGETYTGEFKEKRQAMNKIFAFAKYGDPIY